MAIFKLAITGNNMIYGGQVVLQGGTPLYKTGDGVNFGSGHAIGYFGVLDGRYKVGPSGWSS